MTANDLLQKTKDNLIIQGDGDDALLLGMLTAALDYAQSYQKRDYTVDPVKPLTEQAVVMLASHFYESRDGGTGGFFADNANAAGQVWTAVNRMLQLDKRWEV